MTNGKNWLSRVFAIFVILVAFTACTSTTAELSDMATEGPDLPTQKTPPTSTATLTPPATDGVESTQTALPLPTDFFITSTPFVGSTGDEAIQAPEGKFLFIELIVTHDGTGDLPFGYIDRPLYSFSYDKSVLHSAQILSAKGFDSTSFGLLGQYNRRQGKTGSGATGVLFALNELPYSFMLRIANGDMTELGPDMEEIEVRLEAIYQDGTIQLTIDGANTFLVSGTTWSHHFGGQLLTESFDGFYEINSQIINHGWLDREIIQPAQ